jgi:hypothetical protein
MMKRTILFLSFLLLMILQLSAEGTRRPITLEHKGGPRDGSPLCFDMPMAYYYYNSKTHDIIIDGGGVVSYYDVEISSPVTNTVEMSIQVDGTYDTFDISSLPAGAHVIIGKALHL